MKKGEIGLRDWKNERKKYNNEEKTERDARDARELTSDAVFYLALRRIKYTDILKRTRERHTRE